MKTKNTYKKSNRVAVLQSSILHYREDFFGLLKAHLQDCDLYTTDSEEQIGKLGFKSAKVDTTRIRNLQVKGMLFYSPFFLKSKYDTVVLPLHIGHITSYLLLLLKPIFHKKIILWGHGISIKRYMKEQRKLDKKIKWMISHSDGVWFYTEREKLMWEREVSDIPMVALGNTVSGVNKMLEYKPAESKEKLKIKYGLKEKIVFILCTRFVGNIRRMDLLVELIERLDSTKFGFIIIGAGESKPDFSKYKNVYEFGALYDTSKKQELFYMADIYFQPGWVGLSIVEAMAYGKPIFTFKRSEEIKQCVEYGYVKSLNNGIIFENMNDCVETIELLTKNEIRRMGLNAKLMVKNDLTCRKMSKNALSII